MNSEEEAKLKASFSSAANTLTAFFKTSRDMQKEAFYFGQREAFDEIVNFIVKESNGDIKNLNMNTLLQYIEDRTLQLREKVSEIEKNRAVSDTSDQNSMNQNSYSKSNLPTPFKSYASEMEENSISNKKIPDMASALGLNPENMKYESFGNNQYGGFKK